jgi:hypothetical protein
MTGISSTHPAETMNNTTKSSLHVAGGQFPHSGEPLAINAHRPGPVWQITAPPPAPKFGSTAIHPNRSVEGENVLRSDKVVTTPGARAPAEAKEQTCREKVVGI